MVFSSIIFLFVFLPVMLLAYYISPQQIKNAVLLVGSLFFYAWGEPVYIVLMLFSIAFNYIAGMELADCQAAKNGKRGKRKLIFAVTVNLFVLFYFKYTGFVFTILHLPYEDVALPVGISFYTFQTLSYVIDIYRGKVKVQKNFLNFALYVSMFPQLIAGPIVRYADIAEQLPKRKHSIGRFGIGTDQFLKGLAKKVLLANNIGLLASAIQDIPATDRCVATGWLGAIAYTFQIYFDFSGYSDMAIGLGKMFGFHFEKNFDYPYTSDSVSEFWRRWHISLGNWFREYVYIPLGGNRVPAWKHIRNIFVVWFLTGLWHGAGWNFICWGLYYGIILLLEKKFLGRFLERMPVLLQRLYTMILVVLGWVLFMSDSLQDAVAYLRTMFDFSKTLSDSTTGYYLQTNGILLFLCLICCSPFPVKVFHKITAKVPLLAVLINAILFVASVSYLVYDTYNPFLYFRF